MNTSQYNHMQTFSPDGKVKPLEYINNATGLGTTVIAMSGSDYAVIICHTPFDELSYPTQKVFKIAKNILYTFAGITNDGLEILYYLTMQATIENINKNRDIDPIKVFGSLSCQAALRTVYSYRRPFGAGGLLLHVSENSEISIVEFKPTGEIKRSKATALGNRAHSAISILDSEYDEKMSFDDMVKVGIKAIKNSNKDVKREFLEIWVVGVNKEAEKIDLSEYNVEI